MLMDKASNLMTYAISAPDLLALAPTVRALVVVLLRPHLADAADPDTRVRRAIYRVQTLDRAGGRLRFYVRYAPGLWDVVPSLEAAARMLAAEASRG